MSMVKANSSKSGEKFPIRLLGLSQIKVDHALQSRVATSIEYQRDFSEAMLRGDEFPPIVAFFDGKKYWLADGFHRYGARKIVARMDRKFDQIRAEVRNGSRDDAIVFSAGANQEFSIPRTKEDIKKAVWMLLDNAQWVKFSTPVIAKHVGCSPTTAKKYRAEFCFTKGIPLPTEVEASDGRTYKQGSNIKTGKIYANKQKRCTAFFLSENGIKTYLGTDEDEAKIKAESITSNREVNRRLLQPDALAQHFMHCGFTFKGAGFNPGQYPKLSAYSGHGVVFVSERFERLSGGITPGRSIAETVGCLLLSRAKLDPNARAVVVCYPDDVLPTMLDLGRQLGIEFLTPEEFVASLTPPSNFAPAPPPTEPTP